VSVENRVSAQDTGCSTTTTDDAAALRGAAIFVGEKA
jgi:hypothetical protein